MDPTVSPLPSPPPPTALQGSCLCGRVSYSSSTLPLAVTICHCVPCRKASGNPFLAFGLFHNSALQWHILQPSPDKGSEADIRVDALSNIAVRGYCRNCGTPLFMKYHCRPDGTSVPMGLIDDEQVFGTIRAPKEHIFLAEKARWWQLSETDEAEKYDGFNIQFQKRLREWESRGRPLRKDVGEQERPESNLN